MDFKYTLLWFIRIFMLIAVVVFLVYFVGKANELGASSQDMEYSFYAARVINAISYQESASNRFHYGTIDLENFKYETIKDEFGPEKQSGFGMLIELFDLDDKPFPGAASFYYNKDDYDFMEALSFSKPFMKMDSGKYVLVRDSAGKITPGRLRLVLVYQQK